MKKILHISTLDRGGAANVCISLHDQLLLNGYSSNIISLKKTTIIDRLEQYYDHRDPNSFCKKFYHYQSYLYPFIFNKLLNDQPKQYEVFTFPYSFFDITKHPLYKKADLIHFHYVSYMLNWNSFFSKNTKPIIWRLPDMNTFTGGCHHSEECERYTEDCHNCPQLKNTIIPNFAQKMLSKKLRALSGNIIFITPSIWLQSLAKQSALLRDKDIRFIPNGVDLNTFKKENRKICRIKRGLPLDKKIVLFIVDNFQRKNKGYDILLSSIKNLKNINDMIFIFVGDSFKPPQLMDNYIYFSFINSTKELAEIYSLSDLTVLPSKYETFSLITIESMACGTPVVAFNAAGQKENIHHKVDGYLAEPYSADSFAEGIIYCLNDENNKRLSINCEKKASDSFGLNDMFKSYLAIYQEMLP